MSLTENGNGLIMPVAPMNGYGYGGNGLGFGGDGSWWVILFLFCLMGGWGNGFGGFGGGNGAVPYINNDVQRGFDQSAVMSGINSLNTAVTSGFGNVQTALCGGFAGVNQGVANGFAQAEIAANARQIADMQQAFAAQTASTAGMNTIAQNLQNCCCENRASVADLKYTVATEACADRAAVSDALRDVIAANTASTQKILDQLCQDKIDAKNEKIADLQRQLTMANLAASQGAQTAAILANNDAQTNALEQYLAPVPRPAYIVQNPSCCNQNFGYGCGCGA